MPDFKDMPEGVQNLVSDILPGLPCQAQVAVGGVIGKLYGVSIPISACKEHGPGEGGGGGGGIKPGPIDK